MDYDVPRHIIWGILVSTYSICKSFSNLTDFKSRNKALKAKLLKQDYRYYQHRTCKPIGHTALKWRRINVDATWLRRIDVDRRHFDVVCLLGGVSEIISQTQSVSEIYGVSQKKLLQRGISEPEFYSRESYLFGTIQEAN